MSGSSKNPHAINARDFEAKSRNGINKACRDALSDLRAIALAGQQAALAATNTDSINHPDIIEAHKYPECLSAVAAFEEGLLRAIAGNQLNFDQQLPELEKLASKAIEAIEKAREMTFPVPNNSIITFLGAMDGDKQARGRNSIFSLLSGFGSAGFFWHTYVRSINIAKYLANSRFLAASGNQWGECRNSCSGLRHLVRHC